MRKLSQFKVFRCIAYVVLLPLMLIEQAAKDLRTGYDLWLAMVQQHEAGYRKLTPEQLRMREVTRQIMQHALPMLQLDRASEFRPLPPNDATKTIKFRRYSGFNQEAAC